MYIEIFKNLQKKEKLKIILKLHNTYRDLMFPEHIVQKEQQLNNIRRKDIHDSAITSTLSGENLNYKTGCCTYKHFGQKNLPVKMLKNLASLNENVLGSINISVCFYIEFSSFSRNILIKI